MICEWRWKACAKAWLRASRIATCVQAHALVNEIRPPLNIVASPIPAFITRYRRHPVRAEALTLELKLCRMRVPEMYFT